MFYLVLREALLWAVVLHVNTTIIIYSLRITFSLKLNSSSSMFCEALLLHSMSLKLLVMEANTASEISVLFLFQSLSVFLSLYRRSGGCKISLSFSLSLSLSLFLSLH